MHDIWNPWHGCRKCSEGCLNCYMYYLDSLRDECFSNNITFVFCGTGRRFVKDGKLYKIEGNGLQSEQAFKSGLSFQGKPTLFKLTDEWGYPIPDEKLYKRYFGPKFLNCGMKLTCNGCSRCGKCGSTAPAD